MKICLNQNRSYYSEFILFTDRKNIPYPCLLKFPKKSAVIVRDYDLPDSERAIIALQIKKTMRPTGPRVFIGKNIILAHALKADGVHF